MKLVVQYWFVGCLLMGLPLGAIVKECPRDEINNTELALSVLMWPTLITGLITSSGTRFPPHLCKVAP